METLQSTLPAEGILQDDNESAAAAALARLNAACLRLETLARAEASARSAPFHRVVSLVHEICDALDGAEDAGVGRDALRAAVARAREIHASSEFIKRLQDWPRGYPGDFETIEWLWRGENRAPAGTLAHAFESYALTAPIAQQHRNKVALQSVCLRQAMQASEPCRVLSIGCGSNPDLRSIADQTASTATFVLCDADRNALDLSRRELFSLGERCKYIRGMVPRVLRQVRAHGPFNVILAGGLFDYLSDRFIVRTLHESWRHLLAPRGRILFTNIGRGNPFRVWLEYLASWRLIERSEEDLIRLCRDAEIPVEPTLTRDATGLAIVATLRDPA
jgi:SAM-dependent methyltransferase